MKEQTCIPEREHFFNDLTNQPISEEDYQYALDAFSAIGCSNMYDYLLYYLKLDVILLAIIFSKFRLVCLKEDGLDPVHYLTLPHYSWDCALKKIPCRLTHLPSVEYYEFFQRGIRGGLTFVNEHVAEGELVYVDANNLYGNALSYPLPCSEFEFIDSIDINATDEWGEYGYTLEVDLDYTDEAKSKSWDFPFAPEKIEVANTNFSPFMIQLYQSAYDTI